MRDISRNIYLKSFKYKNCLREKYIINTPIFFEDDKILNYYVEEHNKKLGIYFKNCDIKLKLNNNLNPHIKQECFYNIDLISKKQYFLYWIDYFMSIGYKFCEINEMIIQTISNRRNFTCK